MKGYLSIEEAAARLGVTDRTIRRWVDKHILDALKAEDLGLATGHKRKLLLKEEDIERLAQEIANNKHLPAEQTPTTSQAVADISMTLPDMSMLLKRIETIERDVENQDTVSDVGLLFGKTDTLSERIDRLEQEQEVTSKYLANVAVQLADLTKRLSRLEHALVGNVELPATIEGPAISSRIGTLEETVQHLQNFPPRDNLAVGLGVNVIT